MERAFILYIVLFSFCSCTQDKYTQGEVITKEIIIDFSDKNHSTGEIVFQITKSDDLDVNFSKGEIQSENKYRICADAYNVDGKPVIISLSSQVRGVHEFRLVYIYSSEGLDIEFTEGETLVTSLEVISKTEKMLPSILISIGIAILLIFILGRFFYGRWKDNNTFFSGVLRVSHPIEKIIPMEGVGKIDVAKELHMENISCIISCEQKSVFEEKEEIEKKIPLIEVDPDMKMIVNGEEISSVDYYLEDSDMITVLDSENNELIKMKYNF